MIAREERAARRLAQDEFQKTVPDTLRSARSRTRPGFELSREYDAGQPPRTAVAMPPASAPGCSGGRNAADRMRVVSATMAGFLMRPVGPGDLAAGRGGE